MISNLFQYWYQFSFLQIILCKYYTDILRLLVVTCALLTLLVVVHMVPARFHVFLSFSKSKFHHSVSCRPSLLSISGFSLLLNHKILGLVIKCCAHKPLHVFLSSLVQHISFLPKLERRVYLNRKIL